MKSCVLHKIYIFGGKSLEFMFNFSFPYHSFDDGRLTIFISAQLDCIIDSCDLAYNSVQHSPSG